MLVGLQLCPKIIDLGGSDIFVCLLQPHIPEKRLCPIFVLGDIVKLAGGNFTQLVSTSSTFTSGATTLGITTFSIMTLNM
jgi:hypothetical protein